MAESITRSETNQHQMPETDETPIKDATPIEQIEVHAPTTSSTPIIWTPRFIICFALTLVVGLSLASLLTQGLENHYYDANPVLIGEATLLCVAWIVLAIWARTFWARIGGIFGSLWTISTAMSLVVSWIFADSTLSIVAHLNAATN